MYTLVPVIGGLFLSGVLTKQPKLRETGLLAGEALVDALIVSEVLKVATGRQHPLEGNGGGHFFHGSDSFPSGHTIESFALASAIAHQYQDKKAVVVLSYGFATWSGDLILRRHSRRKRAEGRRRQNGMEIPAYGEAQPVTTRDPAGTRRRQAPAPEK